MKKVLAMLCIGAMVSALVGCGDDESTRMAASSDGDYIAEDEEYSEEEYADEEYTEEEYTDEEYTDEEYADEEYADSEDGDLASEIDKLTDIYVGDYGNGNEIILGLNYTEEVQEAVVMIYNADKQEVAYLNVGSLSGAVGEMQTVTGMAEYPFSFRISEVSDDGQTMVLVFEDDGECPVSASDADYFKEVCTYLGMM